MKKINSSDSRGILNQSLGENKFELTRFKPAEPLQPFVEHYWIVRFDLHDNKPFTQTVLSYPNVHLAIEQDEKGRRALLYGIPMKPFVRKLCGSGHVLGIKFHSGGFYPFWKRDVSLLTGEIIHASEIFGSNIDKRMHSILDAEDDKLMAKQAEDLLRTYIPERDSQAELATDIVQQVMNDRDIIKVEQMSQQTGFSIRQLQRLFRKYVGVTPKWIIKRFRLQEAAQRIEQEQIQLSDLALQLGYFDQAHFIKDFKSVLGQSPKAYKHSTNNT